MAEKIEFPFVARRPGEAARLWVTMPTGVWSDDNATGRHYAELLLDAISKADCSPAMLGFVARAIGETGAWTGIETGFFQRIAERGVGR